MMFGQHRRYRVSKTDDVGVVTFENCAAVTPDKFYDIDCSNLSGFGVHLVEQGDNQLFVWYGYIKTVKVVVSGKYIFEVGYFGDLEVDLSSINVLCLELLIKVILRKRVSQRESDKPIKSGVIRCHLLRTEILRQN